MSRTESIAFHNGLGSQPIGTRAWADENTEIENLGAGRFAAHIGDLQVFKDVDGQWRKHRVLDLRSEGKGIVLKSAKCCVELHGYYAKLYNPTYTRVRVGEERFAVEGFDPQDSTWKIVLAPRPTLPPSNIEIEEGVDFVRAQATYENENGVLTLEYFQQDTRSLKHNITFQSKIGGTVQFRVIHRWNKIRFRRLLTIIEERELTGLINIGPQRFLKFLKQEDRRQIILGNFSSLYYWNESTGEYETEILKAIVADIEDDPTESKIYFVYGNWELSQGESLEIDPDTATLNDPTEDGQIGTGADTVGDCLAGVGVSRDGTWMRFGGATVSKPTVIGGIRSYVEWPIVVLAGGTLTTNPVFKYDGESITGSITDEEINPITEEAPSGATDLNLWGYCVSGVAYVDPWTFTVGDNQSDDLGAAAKADLQAAMDVSQSWFAIGFVSPAQECPAGVTFNYGIIVPEEGTAPTPPPTLYVEYTPAVAEGGGAGAVAEIGVKSLILDLLLEGVLD